MTGATMLARVVSFQRAFLLSVALEHGRIQIQAVTVGTYRQAFHLPLGQWRLELVNLSHSEAPKQIADRIVAGKARHTE